VNPEFAKFVNDAADIKTSGRWGAMNAKIERLAARPGAGNEWYVQLLGALPHPFHLYSMRQAIEEGFILDVLQNYMTYRAYYALEKAIEDDPKFIGTRARRRVARFASLHPTTLIQKIEVIVEHFRRHVLKELDGNAKAMIVTQSREHALRYYFALKTYLQQKAYTDMRALVAFSGDLALDGQTYTEAEVNGFPETELPRRFNTDAYQVLIVAEKYQTGFDLPKLCAMYVDRKLAGLQAVQTLSRLNRTYPGKENTFVLDFQNAMEDVQTAFKPYFETTTLEALSDPNQVYQLEARLRKFGVIDQGEVERFAAPPCSIAETDAPLALYLHSGGVTTTAQRRKSRNAQSWLRRKKVDLTAESTRGHLSIASGRIVFQKPKLLVQALTTTRGEVWPTNGCSPRGIRSSLRRNCGISRNKTSY
jgi:superfamily II DNA or RNA helicase